MELSNLIVTTEEGSEIETEKVDDETYTFTMPNGSVEVEGEFEEEIMTLRLTVTNGDTRIMYKGLGDIQPILKYRKSGQKEFSDYELNSWIELNNGDYIDFIGNNTNAVSGFYAGSPAGLKVEDPSIDIIVSGHIMALMDDQITNLPDGCFDEFFYSLRNNIIDASELILGDKSSSYSYRSLLANTSKCNGYPSILPAPSLNNACYAGMFHACSQLNELTVLATSGFDSGWYSYQGPGWLDNTAQGTTGTLHVVSQEVKDTLESLSGCIPSNWTVVADAVA